MIALDACRLTTMLQLIFAIVALNLYLASGTGLAWHVSRRDDVPRARGVALLLGLAAVAAHAGVLYQTVLAGPGFTLGFFNSASLIAALMAVVVLLSALRAPTENLGVLVMPIAALALLLSLIFDDARRETAGVGIEIHILVSVLAYSVLAIAALQALLLAAQEYQLRHKHPTGLSRLLPPLQVMEALLFRLLQLGFIGLSLSLLTGFIFLEDMFAQHVAHKTVLSIIAWCLFAVLLWGRQRFGWRGRTAIRWTLGGFVALMLAYFGSKLVIELILS